MKRAGLLGIILFALLLRVSIPTGMMLVAAEGGPRIVPCPSAMPAPLPSPAIHGGGHGSHHPQQSGHHHNTPEPPPCPFGVLLFPALPSAPPMLALRAPEPGPVPAPRQTLQAPSRALAYLRPPATGPPLAA